MEQAYINETSLSTYGVVLLKGWREAFLFPPDNKEYITNESRLEHGIRYNTGNINKKAKEISLQFFLEGSSDDDYIDKLETFMNIISSGIISVRIPKLKNRVYKLVYTGIKQYGMYGAKKGKFVINFVEPNPVENDNNIS